MEKIRKLQLEDAKYMLDWMHDPDIADMFKRDFRNYEIEDAENFIKNSFDSQNQHFALTDENDVYLGTISLKSISPYSKKAELNSVFRKGVSETSIANGIKIIMEYAFGTLELNELYIHFYENNCELIEFYKDLGFQKGGTFTNPLYIQKTPRKVCWYYKKNNVDDTFDKHRLLLFQERGDSRGHMIVIEQMKDIPFEIKRVFYMYGSDREAVRGNHANRKSEFVLVNVSGKSKIKVFDGITEYIYELTQPHMGVYISKMVWKEMYDFSEDSVLLVLASELYDANEYIRDIRDYMKEIKESEET